MGNNPINIVHGVTVPVLCTWSDHGLQLFQVSQKYLEQFKSYGGGMISILIITKGHNSINIACGVTILVLCTSSNHCLLLYQVLQKYFELFQNY